MTRTTMKQPGEPGFPTTVAELLTTEIAGGFGLGFALFARIDGGWRDGWFGHGGANTGTGGDMAASLAGGRGLVFFGNGPNDVRRPLLEQLTSSIVAAHGWSVPDAATTHFAFHSDFATNLNDALLEAGRARNDERPELFTEEPERSCFASLSPSEQQGWHHAVGYYADVISTGRWSDRLQVVLRMALSGVEQREQPRDLRFLGIARGMLDAAAPAFRACRWPAQDAENRRWIEQLVASLEQHAEAVSERLARHYDKPLGGLPMRVDVMETVNWSGATTWILDPAGGHIQISREEPAAAALELVFHEASHTLMRRGAPIQRALRSAADRAGVELPRDLWHGVLFYTTG